MLETKPVLAKKENLLLTATQKQNYHRDGFLILNDFIEKNVCDLLIEQARKLIENYDAVGMKTIFSSKDQHHARNLYFLESGDKIRFFFEEGAFDSEGGLKTDKLFCINKIGHALHDLDPVFNCFSRCYKIAALANDLGIHDPLLAQSMYICKQPFIGGEVLPHQDSTYLFVKNEPVTGLWFALEDATIENGCLWAIPGGHKVGLKSRMLRDANNHISTEIYDETPWPLEKMTALEVPRGTLIVLHGLLPHMSKENRSSRSRHAYTLHLISGQCEYASDNWLQRNDFRGFL